MIFNGLLNLSVWGDIAAALILTHITIIGVTVFLHRHQAHRSLELHKIPSHFFRFWLWLTTGMNTKAWAAIHRKHHARCETPEDPHSPQIFGLKKVLWEGAELYRAEAKNQETLERYGSGTPDDWIERHIYTPKPILGLTLMAVIDIVLFGIPGISIWGIQMLWIPFFAAGIINGVGHYWGYRNFECADASRNIFPWGIIIGGEELHNNHHTFGTSAKLSVKWWEFDLGWFYIRLLEMLKLARVKKSIVKLEMIPGKTQLDIEALKAVISQRLQVMASYTNDVIKPVIQEEKRRASATGRKVLQRAKALLISADNLVDAENKQYLSEVLKERQSLALVYQYRQKLQDIWGHTTANQRELLEALQAWCKEAENAGIESLRQFAGRLRGSHVKA